MAHSILTQLKKRSEIQAQELGLTDRVYKAMMEDARDEIREKAVSEARIAIQSELSAAQATAARAQADVEKSKAVLTRATAEKEALSATIARMQQTEKDLLGKVAAMEKMVKLEQGTLTAKDLEYKNQIKDLESTIRELKGTVHDLEMSNSRLTGQLEAKPTTTRVVRKKQSDPEFEIIPTYGGPENRIVSAQVKLKR